MYAHFISVDIDLNQILIYTYNAPADQIYILIYLVYFVFICLIFIWLLGESHTGILKIKSLYKNTFWTYELPSVLNSSNFSSCDLSFTFSVVLTLWDEDGTLLLIGWLDADDVKDVLIGWDDAVIGTELSIISGISHDWTEETLGNFSLHFEPSTSIKCFEHLHK